MKFFKYQGCGNDYVYVDCFRNKIDNPEELSKKVSNRNFGIGSDGLVLILPSENADAKMRIFNSDGSEAKMCGNGIRCVAKYIVDNKNYSKKKLTIETLSGIKKIEIIESGNMVSKVKVDMGSPESIRSLEFKEILKERCIYVSMGNPHCVVFCSEINSIDLTGPGNKIQSCFKDGINVEFVKIESKNKINVRVLERGSGETLACGTGACASVVAANYLGLCDNNVTVHLRGGDILIEYENNTVFMTGEAVKVFEGEYYG